MKEIEKKVKDKISITAQRQIEKQTLLIGTSKLQAGHRCFEINTKTLSVKQAEFEAEVNFSKQIKYKVVTKPDCVYINALNAKNALKVYHKGGRKETKPIFNISDYPTI